MFFFNNSSPTTAALALVIEGTPVSNSPLLVSPGIAYSVLTPTAEAALSGVSPLYCLGANASSSHISTPDNSALTGGTITFSGTPPKALGSPANRPGCKCVGDPIDPSTGNVFEQKTDYTTAGQNPLSFTRYYNSMGQTSNSTTYATTLGPNWRMTYDRYLNVSSTTAYAERGDGQVLNFTLSGSTWVPDSDIDYTLTSSGSTWTLTDPNDSVETYTVTSGKGILNSIALRNGYTQTMTYSSGLLSSVSDSYSRSLGLTYSSGLLSKVTTPDSTSTGITFAYNSNGALSTVTYPTSTATTLTYLYTNASLPFALTGITDENGNTYATWGYDSSGRATSNYMGGSGVNGNSVTISYASSTPVVTNAYSVADTYTFTTYQGVPKVTGISRASTSTTAAATRSFTYDSNGYLATATDWNGNEVQYTNNSHGLPTEIKKAYGSTVEQDTAIVYDSTWVHLPYTVTQTGITTTFTYQSGTGNVLTRVEADTTSGSTPYSTNGTTRTWTNTWGTSGNIGLLLTVTGPRTDVTQTTTFAYSGGITTSITDGLSHVTTINTSTPGGLPTKITDPNSVITTYTYDGRQRLLTKTVDTSGGNYTTTNTYDSAGNLTQIKIPDGTHSDYTYDNAHWLTKVTNANGEYISYTLDYLGDRTVSDIYNSSSTLTRKHTATFDALGRMLTDVGWSTTSSSMTTTYAYDPQGNATSIQDRRGHTTSQSFDALNRLHQVTDRLSHTTTTNYDTNNLVTSVVDPNSHTTSYTRDGFGRAIQQVSPDSGTTVYHYDLAGNMTKKVDGASVETDFTYDKLDRELTRTFPADSTRNISKTYDQTGGTFGYGDGVGHLTSMTDNAGTMNRQFEERGNIVHHQRLNGTAQIDTYSYYDQNNRPWTYVNPDQWTIEIGRDNAGQVTSLSSHQQSGTWVWTGFTTVVSSVTHLPFGPVSGLSFANGITKTNAYDLDYRLTETKDAATSNVMDLQYTYDNNDNPTSIADTVNAANSMTTTGTGQGYDAVDRFLGAASGTGGYGTLTYTYDANGNRSTEVRNGTTVTYTYNSGTNQIYGFNDSNNTNYVYNGAGEITKQYYGTYYDLQYAYDVTQQLYQPTYQGSGSPAFSAAYDGFGMRQGKSANVYWTYGYGVDGTTLIEESSLAGQLVDYVYLDGQLVALNEMTNYGMSGTTEATYYVHADRLGTPQAVTNGSKTLSWKQFYEPFGWPYSYSNPAGIVQDFGFPGQLDDAETDVAYNGARYYNYLTGAYIQTDPIGLNAGTTNTYTYANSNPFRWTDRSGLESFPFQNALPPAPQYYPTFPSVDPPGYQLRQSWSPTYTGYIEGLLKEFATDAGLTSALAAETGFEPAALGFAYAGACAGGFAYMIDPNPLDALTDAAVDVLFDQYHIGVFAEPAKTIIHALPH